MAANEQDFSEISNRIQSRRRRFTQLNLFILLLFLGIMGFTLIYGFQKYSQLQDIDQEVASTSAQLEELADEQAQSVNVDSLSQDISGRLAADVLPELVEEQVASKLPPPPRTDSELADQILAQVRENLAEDKTLARLSYTQDSLKAVEQATRQRIQEYETEMNRLRGVVELQQETISQLETALQTNQGQSLRPLSTTRILSERAGVAFNELGLVVTVGRFSSGRINNVSVFRLDDETQLFKENLVLDSDASFTNPDNPSCTHLIRIRRITRIPLFKDQMQVVIQTRC